jgi:hypothetical protein
LKFQTLALLGAAFGILVLAGCSRQQVAAGAPPRLLVGVFPPSPTRLDPGTLIRITARPEPSIAMDWVSGTVRILGAPVTAFRRGEDGTWGFKTMVPPMVTVPPGTYAIKVWGRAHDGEALSGTLSYEVE